jgi:hypothetical protein
VGARDDLAIDERLAHERRLDVGAPVALQQPSASHAISLLDNSSSSRKRATALTRW